MDNQQGTEFLYKVDIVMCIDATGSMSPIISEVKENALAFYQKFVDSMEENDKDVAELRIKVIVFRDYGCDTEPMTESAFFCLPQQNEEFKAFVTAITPCGGGDGPENALEAIALALKSDWAEGGQNIKCRHTILMFTDAPALNLGERSSSPNYPAGMPADLAELGSWWEGTSQELSGTYRPQWGRLIAFVPDAEPWTLLSAWNRVFSATSKAGAGLDDVTIQSAIDILVGSI